MWSTPVRQSLQGEDSVGCASSSAQRTTWLSLWPHGRVGDGLVNALTPFIGHDGMNGSTFKFLILCFSFFFTALKTIGCRHELCRKKKVMDIYASGIINKVYFCCSKWRIKSRNKGICVHYFDFTEDLCLQMPQRFCWRSHLNGWSKPSKNHGSLDKSW